MITRKILKRHFNVPENWDKHDYQIKQYSFGDLEEAFNLALDRVEKFSKHDDRSASFNSGSFVAGVIIGTLITCIYLWLKIG